MVTFFVERAFFSENGLLEAFFGAFPVLVVEQTEAPIILGGCLRYVTLCSFFEDFYTFFGVAHPSVRDSQIEERFVSNF